MRVKEVGKRFLALRAIKDVVLFDFDPGLLAALCTELILEAREFLLLFEELFARLDPLVLLNNFVAFHRKTFKVCLFQELQYPIPQIMTADGGQTHRSNEKFGTLTLFAAGKRVHALTRARQFFNSLDVGTRRLSARCSDHFRLNAKV